MDLTVDSKNTINPDNTAMSSNAIAEHSVDAVEQEDTCCSGCVSQEDEDVQEEEEDSCCEDCKSETKLANEDVSARNECSQKNGCCSGAQCEDSDLKSHTKTNKKGECCSGNESNEDEKCCGQSDCNRPESIAEKQADDDSFCMCCINVLINEPDINVKIPIDEDIALNRSSTFNSRSQLVPSTSRSDGITGTLRTCCKIFEKYCVRRSCCFVSQPTSGRSPITRGSKSLQRPVIEQLKPKQSKEFNSSTSNQVNEKSQHYEKLELEIRGMDCIDCAPKVERALANLTSVGSVNIDYFNGMAELVYDPEAIKPIAISNYVARATGFSVKAVDPGPKGDKESFVTLPLYFSTIPSPEIFKGFDFRIGTNPHIIELQFPIHGDRFQRPRDVFDQFKIHGAELASPASERGRDMATRDLINLVVRTTIAAIFTIPVLVLAWAKLRRRPILYGGISLGLTTIVQVLALPIISSAIRSIVYLHRADMNLLVSMSTLAAYIFSVVAYSFEVKHKPFSTPFFETSCLLITLILLGRTISAMTRRSTGSALNGLRQLQQDNVLLVVDGKTPTEPLDSRLLFYSDVIRIPPNTRIATDGIIIYGESDVDESSFTGESGSVSKRAGNRVIAGTLNLSGTMDVQVTRLVHENSLARIVSLVRRAQSSRSPIQNIVDRLSAVILPVAVVSAITAFVVWVLVGRFGRHRSTRSASLEALTYAIAVLAVSCPCAIGLVTPTVVSIAIRRGIREGILFRSAESLQSGHNVDVVAFDKTGTLTTGNLRVDRADILVDGAEDIIDSLVKDNKHPISQAIHGYLSSRIPSDTKPQKRDIVDITLLPGKGIKASIGGYPLLGGSPEFTGAITHPLFSSLCSSGYSLFTVTLAGQTIAFFGLVTTPRPNAKALITELKRRGKSVFIFSGDNHAAVNQLATAVGIPAENARAGCTPEDKSAAIAAFQAEGRRVCFVGDGTNDGPALSQANIAISIVAGSDVALTAAGALLLGSDIHRGVIGLLDIARASRIHTHVALGWCVIYNVFAILLAAGALVKVRIEPRWAGIGEVVSVVPVILIAFALEGRWIWRNFKLRKAKKDVSK